MTLDWLQIMRETIATLVGWLSAHPWLLVLLGALVAGGLILQFTRPPRRRR